MYQNAASCMFYFICNGKNKSNVLYPYSFQTLIFKALYIFTIKTKKKILKNVKSVSAYVLRTLLFSRRKRTFQDRDSKDQNSLDPERQPKD